MAVKAKQSMNFFKCDYTFLFTFNLELTQLQNCQFTNLSCKQIFK